MSADPRLPFVYVGPSTAWGLMSGVRCRIVERTTQAPGVCKIATKSGKEWLVRRALVERLGPNG